MVYESVVVACSHTAPATADDRICRTAPPSRRPRPEPASPVSDMPQRVAYGTIQCCGSLVWPFTMLKYKQFIFRIKYTEAVLSDSTRKLLWFEITELLIAVLKKKIIIYRVIYCNSRHAVVPHTGRSVLGRSFSSCRLPRVPVARSWCGRSGAHLLARRMPPPTGRPSDV